MRDAKRLFDLAGVGLAAAIFGPVLPILGAAIALDDGLPLLFVQERIGEDRVPFRIFKLRTMRDGRVTRAGRWLRATGLDELPQFLNVLRGEMSIVGPRPLTLEDVRRFGWDTSLHDARFAVRPGIVGIAQVVGGRSARHTARLDALYARRVSVSLDALLVLAGFTSNVVGKRGMRALLTRLRRRRPRSPRPPATDSTVHVVRCPSAQPFAESKTLRVPRSSSRA